MRFTGRATAVSSSVFWWVQGHITRCGIRRLRLIEHRVDLDSTSACVNCAWPLVKLRHSSSGPPRIRINDMQIFISMVWTASLPILMSPHGESSTEFSLDLEPDDILPNLILYVKLRLTCQREISIIDYVYNFIVIVGRPNQTSMDRNDFLWCKKLSQLGSAAVWRPDSQPIAACFSPANAFARFGPRDIGQPIGLPRRRRQPTLNSLGRHELFPFITCPCVDQATRSAL